MTTEIVLSWADVERIAREALLASNTSRDNAECVSRSIAAAEADGLRSHGLMRVPAFCEQALCGKIDGHAKPSFELPPEGAAARPGVIRIDARDGFAHPAIELGFASLLPAARE